MSDIERLQRQVARERAARREAEAIAETKTLEAYLAKKKLADAIESIQEGFVLFDADDRLELCNSRYMELLYPGLRAEVRPGRTYEEIIRVAANRGLVWEARGRVDAWVGERLDEHRAAAGSRIQPWSEGRWLMITERRTVDGGIVAVYTDVTEVKATETALRESEERYALAMAGANEGMWDWHIASGEIFVSESFTRLLHLPAVDARVQPDAWRAEIHPDDLDRREEAMRRHHDGFTEYYECEYRMRGPKGDWRWVQDRARSVRDEMGDIRRMAGSVSDISERKQAERELLEAKSLAERANREATEKSRKLEELSNKLAKYLSPQIYELIFSGQQDVRIYSKRKKLTIFFSDIVGFTSTTDRLESEELTELLNNYLTEMSRIAHEFGATIDKYVGDAIIAFFGDPTSMGSKEDALACVRMAIVMQRRMCELGDQWRAAGLERPFELRIGINTGYCTVGNFGSADRMAYTIIGNEVNLTARIESSAEVGGILLSHETNSLVSDEIETLEQQPITAKGFAAPVRTYKVLNVAADALDTAAIVRYERPGFRFAADLAALAGAERDDATRALEALLARLRS